MTETTEPPNSREPDAPEGVPAVLVNSTQIQTGPYGLILLCGLRRHDGTDEPEVEIHMSLEHAKVVGHLIVKQLQSFEEQHGEIPLPLSLRRELLQGTALEPEDDDA